MPGKRVQIDEDTLVKLTNLGRRRMATFQELVDEALADLLKKHGIPIDLNDALKKSVKQTGATTDTPPRRRRGVKPAKKQRAR